MTGSNDIPVVILCGGEGTRMRGSTLTKKELVEIGGRPIIWHVMRIFSAFGHNRFILALGYGSDQLKRYFLHYEALHRDITLRLGGPAHSDQQAPLIYHGEPEHDAWQVSLIDTGPANVEKASRIARVSEYLEADLFFVTYGDGVGNVDLKELVRFHRHHGKMATVTGVQVRFQYGTLEADDHGQVAAYSQKPLLPNWINAGFMLFNHSVLELMRGDDIHLERQVLPALVEQGELMLYRHRGFWRSMDTLKDTVVLEQLWQESAPWKVW